MAFWIQPFSSRHSHNPSRYAWDWDVVDRPLRLFDQHFGSGLLGDDLLAPSLFGSGPFGLTSAVRPRHLHSRERSGLSEVKCDKDKFQVMLDVQQFKPEEIEVKTVDNFVVIKAKHEEKVDEHGFISREFTRKYMIPDDIKPETVQCNMSSDGVLMITAPREPKKELPSNERVLTIGSTGQPAITKQPQTEGGSGGDVQMKE